MAKVLIVEDDEILQKMYSVKFRNDGFEVEIAGDGLEGLLKMKSFLPDVVLMDVMMPKLDGISAVGRAKADESIKQIPIIMLTNLSGVQDVDVAIQKGALLYIIKSNFTPSQIVAKVEEVLGISPVPEQNPAPPESAPAPSEQS